MFIFCHVVQPNHELILIERKYSVLQHIIFFIISRCNCWWLWGSFFHETKKSFIVLSLPQSFDKVSFLNKSYFETECVADNKIVALTDAFVIITGQTINVDEHTFVVEGESLSSVGENDQLIRRIYYLFIILNDIAKAAHRIGIRIDFIFILVFPFVVESGTYLSLADKIAVHVVVVDTIRVESRVYFKEIVVGWSGRRSEVCHDVYLIKLFVIDEENDFSTLLDRICLPSCSFRDNSYFGVSFALNYFDFFPTNFRNRLNDSIIGHNVNARNSSFLFVCRVSEFIPGRCISHWRLVHRPH